MKTISRKALILDFVVLVMCLSVPRMLEGSSFSITDLVEPNITVAANDFELGFSVNGVQLQRGLGSPASVTLSEAAGTLSFVGSWGDRGQTVTNSNTVYFTEGPGSNLVSDILTYNASTNHGAGVISGTFQSDVSGNLGTVPAGAFTWDENAGAFTFDQPFLTASAASDSAAFEPEPGTLLLLGSGLLGVMGVARRKWLTNADV